MVWERYCNASPKPEFFFPVLFIFFVYIFIHISANMSPFGLKFSQMILHTETSKLMYNLSFLFVVLHKPRLLYPVPLSCVTKITDASLRLPIWIEYRECHLLDSIRLSII